MQNVGRVKQIPWFTRLLFSVALIIVSATGCGKGSSALYVKLPNGMIIHTIPEAPDKSAPI